MVDGDWRSVFVPFGICPCPPRRTRLNPMTETKTRLAWAAAGWSAVYALFGLLWTVGVPGYPFGENDVPDARAESALGATTAAGAAPVVAVLGAAGVVVGLALARGWGRTVPAVLGAALAVGLLIVVPDQRPLVAVAYLPIVLVGSAVGGYSESFGTLMGKLLPWPVVNLVACQVGGLLFAAATIVYLRRARNSCARCGRTGGVPARFATPEAAARWGRRFAIVAAILPFGYAVVRWAWAFDIPLGLSGEELAELHASGLVWAGAYLATFAAVGGILTLGLTYRWGEVWPRWVLGLAGRRVPPALPVTLGTVVTVVLASTLVTVIRTADWDSPATNPMLLWPLWAVCLGGATLAYHYRTRGRCPNCQPVAIQGTLEL
jgi:hypothetical protein